MADTKLPSPDTLRQLLDYDPDTGVLTWKHRDVRWFCSDRAEYRQRCWNTRYAGREAFTSRTNGYADGRVLQVAVAAHRVAIAITTGNWPQGQIDHVNGNKSDNRLSNLRVVSQAENLRNAKKSTRNTSGHTGVYASRAGKWFAQIYHDGKCHTLGTFETFDDAKAARLDAERIFGFHPLHGKK